MLMPASGRWSGGRTWKGRMQEGGKELRTQLTHGALFVFRWASPIHAFLESATSTAFLVRRHLRLLSCLRTRLISPLHTCLGLRKPRPMYQTQSQSTSYLWASGQSRHSIFDKCPLYKVVQLWRVVLSSENRKRESTEKFLAFFRSLFFSKSRNGRNNTK